MRKIGRHGLSLTRCLLLLCPVVAMAQGQDSTAWERDLQVIATLLAGGYNNANQRYFDGRSGADVVHRGIHAEITSIDTNLPDGQRAFSVVGYHDNVPNVVAVRDLWTIGVDDAREAVTMQVRALPTAGPDGADVEAALHGPVTCELVWRREAAQFRASAATDCGTALREIVLSERQLWLTWPGDGKDFRLHRVRYFECYADIPGVGGGRDEPYDRYEGFEIHDMGGQAWFTSKEGRELGISLFLVDWPINNYDGVFTRDSFVIYVSEKADGKRTELGYAFTVPEADRIGINLKWMLASCYMSSNRDETPYM